MTTTSKPTTNPSWTTGQPTQIAQPTPSLQASGFTAGQRPTAQHLNFLFYNLSNWVQYLDAQANGQLSRLEIGSTMRLLGGGTWSYSAANNTLAWSEPFALSTPSIDDADNTVAPGSVIIKPGQIAYVLANLPFATTGTTSAGSTAITQLPYEVGIETGQLVAGNGIPANTTVTAVNDGQVSISRAATATASNVYLTFTGAAALSVKAADTISVMPSPSLIVIATASAGNVYLGINSGQMRLADGEQKRLLASGYLHTQTVTAGQPLRAGQLVYLSNGSDADNIVASLALGSTTMTNVSSTALVTVGSPIGGVGLPQNTFVTAVGANTLSLSAAATATTNAVSYVVSRISGAAYLADAASNTGAVRANVAGIVITTTTASATAAYSVRYMTSGVYGNLSGLSTGSVYYLDPTTPGAITANKPSAIYYSNAIGVALSATSLYVQPSALARPPTADSSFNDVSLAPIAGSIFPVRLRITDAAAVVQANIDAAGNAYLRGALSASTLVNSTATFGVDTVGNLSALTTQSAAGSATAPSQTYVADLTTGSFLATVSSTKAVLAWAVNKVRLLSLSATGLVSGVATSAPSVSSDVGFKCLLEAGLYYAGPNAANQPNAPTTYQQLLQPMVNNTNINAGYNATHSGSVVGCCVYLQDPIRSSGYTYSVQIVLTDGVSYNTVYQATDGAPAGSSVAAPKGRYAFGAGDSVTAFIKFSNANVVTRVRVVLTLALDA